MFSPLNIYFKPWGIKYFQTAYVKLNFIVKDQNLQIWRVKEKKKKCKRCWALPIYSPPKASNDLGKNCSRTRPYFAGLQSSVLQIPSCLQHVNNFNPECVLKKMPFRFWRNFHIGLVISTSHPTALGKLWSVREKRQNKSTPPVIRENFWAGEGKEADLFCPSCWNSLGETENMRYRIKTSQAKSGQVSFQTFDTRILVKIPTDPLSGFTFPFIQENENTFVLHFTPSAIWMHRNMSSSILLQQLEWMICLESGFITVLYLLIKINHRKCCHCMLWA